MESNSRVVIVVVVLCRREAAEVKCGRQRRRQWLIGKGRLVLCCAELCATHGKGKLASLFREAAGGGKGKAAPATAAKCKPGV